MAAIATIASTLGSFGSAVSTITSAVSAFSSLTSLFGGGDDGPAPVQIQGAQEAPPAATVLTADTTASFEEAQRSKRLIARRAKKDNTIFSKGSAEEALTQKTTLLGN